MRVHVGMGVRMCVRVRALVPVFNVHSFINSAQLDTSTQGQKSSMKNILKLS